MDKKNIKIAVLSGKGGTGKTLISVNLAAAAENSLYIDCDVEEPNGHLFFKPKDISEEEVFLKIPVVDKALCDGCRKCLEFCNFNALAYIGGKIKVFEDICHSCGGCVLACPKKAFSEKDRSIGKIYRGVSNNVLVHSGVLNIGEASGVEIISKMIEDSKSSKRPLCFIDSPPGIACTAMESIKLADFCILVAEPTIFGLHNFVMVHKLLKAFNKPFVAIINKVYDNENIIQDYCKENDIKVLYSLSFDNELGLKNSNGDILVRKSKKYKAVFGKILQALLEEVQDAAIINS